MRWFEEQRMEWIGETIRIFGFINREHIIKKFGVSMPQASNDLSTFIRNNPETILYNTTTRRYEAIR